MVDKRTKHKRSSTCTLHRFRTPLRTQLQYSNRTQTDCEFTHEYLKACLVFHKHGSYKRCTLYLHTTKKKYECIRHTYLSTTIQYPYPRIPFEQFKNVLSNYTNNSYITRKPQFILLTYQFLLKVQLEGAVIHDSELVSMSDHIYMEVPVY